MLRLIISVISATACLGTLEVWAPAACTWPEPTSGPLQKGLVVPGALEGLSGCSDLRTRTSTVAEILTQSTWGCVLIQDYWRAQQECFAKVWNTVSSRNKCLPCSFACQLQRFKHLIGESLLLDSTSSGMYHRCLL